MWRLFLLIISFPVISKGQVITTIAGGSSTSLGDGGPATLANLGLTPSVALDDVGNIYIANPNHNRIRWVEVATGIINTVAGDGAGGYSGDGLQATNAKLNSPQYVALDKHNNLYISDVVNRRVRKVDRITGIISTIAGNGTMGYSGDGLPATDASIITPQGLAIDTSGNLFITDLGARVIRKVNTFGIISTVAGDGTVGYGGDGGAATNAKLGNPQGVSVDTFGNLYISDYNNNRIRKVDYGTSIISTVVGSGAGGYIGDGMDALVTQLNGPMSVAFDLNKNMHIADFVNNRVRKVDHITGLITTVAGNGSPGFAGDGGPATAATLWHPSGLAFDACGNMYVSDDDNKRIRKVTYNPPTTPIITVTAVNTATLGATVTVNAAVSGAGSSYTIKWFKNATLFSTTTVPTTTYTKGTGTDVITARVVPTMLTCYDSATSAGHTITQQTVGLSSIQLGEFQIYPNPVGNIIAISGNEPINSLLITDIMSRAVATFSEPSTKKHELQWHIGNLPKGVYFIKVNDWYVQRFLKE